eukprot:758707-Hanusia_phi.AAC.2
MDQAILIFKRYAVSENCWLFSTHQIMPQFLQVIEKQKDAHGSTGEDWDMVSAFVALGGNPDKSGEINTDKLRATIEKFELTIDIERLIEETDTDASGLIDYEEFKAMLS